MNAKNTLCVNQRLEMVKQKSAASNKPEEEAKVPASDASALDPARQSYSEGFMKSIDRKALASALPKIEPDQNRGAAAADMENPLDELDVQVGVDKADGDAAKNNQESLEERKLRLEARREALQKKKRDEEEAKALANAPIEMKRDQGDIFRNTQMKFNEAPEQKKMRLKRCLVALSEAGVGKPNFVGMEVGKPIQINWQGEAIDINVEDGTDEVAVRVEKAGKRIQDDDGF